MASPQLAVESEIAGYVDRWLPIYRAGVEPFRDRYHEALAADAEDLFTAGAIALDEALSGRRDSDLIQACRQVDQYAAELERTDMELKLLDFASTDQPN